MPQLTACVRHSWSDLAVKSDAIRICTIKQMHVEDTEYMVGMTYTEWKSWYFLKRLTALNTSLLYRVSLHFAPSQN
jgi:hypothetical protein